MTKEQFAKQFQAKLNELRAIVSEQGEVNKLTSRGYVPHHEAVDVYFLEFTSPGWMARVRRVDRRWAASWRKPIETTGEEERWAPEVIVSGASEAADIAERAVHFLLVEGQ